MEKIKSTDAFTLTELLVSVAIVGLLASLLISGMASTKEKALQVQCTGQMRQIFSTMSLYSSDNDNAYPQALGSAPSPRGWMNWCWTNSPLAPYAGGSESLLRLSVCPSNRTPTPPLETQGESKYGYPYTMNYYVVAPDPNPRIKVSAVSRPGKTLLMTDSAKGAQWGAGFTLPPFDSRMGTPHLKKMNTLWCDGHVTLEDKANLVSGMPNIVYP